MDNPTTNEKNMPPEGEVLVGQGAAVEEKPQSSTTLPAPVDPSLDDYYLINPFFYDIANYFGVEQKDFDIAAPKLSVIVDWAREQYELKRPEDILLKIREVEDNIQSPAWDEKRYINLYRYVRLANHKLSVEKAMKAFEKGDK